MKKKMVAPASAAQVPSISVISVSVFDDRAILAVGRMVGGACVEPTVFQRAAADSWAVVLGSIVDGDDVRIAVVDRRAGVK